MNPMDAVHWAGIDRFLDAFCAVSVLPDRTGTTKPGFDDKSVRGDMGAISTTDTNGFVHPNGLFTQCSTKTWLKTGGNNLRLCRGKESL